MRQNKNAWFYIGGSGLDRTDDFQKFCGLGLDWIQFYRISTGLGLKNFTVRSSLVHGTITVYEFGTIRIGTMALAFWVRVSFPEGQSLLEAGCTDVQIAWTLWVRILKHFESRHTIYSYFDFGLKNSSFQLPYQRPSSSADCARGLFKVSNGLASLVDSTRKKFWVGGCGFIVSDVISEVLLGHFGSHFLA